MYIVIVGGGKVGYYLAKTLASEKHHLMLIDEDPSTCSKLLHELQDRNVHVVQGDGTKAEFLEDAEVSRAAVLIAVTGDDENNLVACQIAKNYFHVRRTIARVNNPKNIQVFRKLGVDKVVSSTARIADIIEMDVDWEDINQIIPHDETAIRIREYTVSGGSAAAGRSIEQLVLPGGTVLVAVIREGKTILPNGRTVIHTGDDVVALTGEDNAMALSDMFESQWSEFHG